MSFDRMRHRRATTLVAESPPTTVIGTLVAAPLLWPNRASASWFQLHPPATFRTMKTNHPPSTSTTAPTGTTTTSTSTTTQALGHTGGNTVNADTPLPATTQNDWVRTWTLAF